MRVSGFGSFFSSSSPPPLPSSASPNSPPPPSPSSFFQNSTLHSTLTPTSVLRGLTTLAPPLLSTLIATSLLLHVLTSSSNPLSLPPSAVRLLQTLSFPFPAVPCLRILRRLPTSIRRRLPVGDKDGGVETVVDDVLVVGATPAGDYPYVIGRLMADDNDNYDEEEEEEEDDDPPPRFFINLCAEWPGPFPPSPTSSLLVPLSHPTLPPTSASQLHVPTLDHRNVAVPDLVLCIDALRAHRTEMKRRSGRGVVEGSGGGEGEGEGEGEKEKGEGGTKRRTGGRAYVHCKAGHGRSASVGLGWMMYRYGCGGGGGGGGGAFVGKDVRALNEEMVRRRRVRKHMWKQDNIVELERRIKNGEVGVRKKGREGEITAEEDPFTWEDFDRKYGNRDKEVK